MRFHVVNLPHTQTTKDFCWCAYTSKVLRFCNMMTSIGHEVYLYGGTQNEANVKEFVSVVSEDDHRKWFGHYNWDTMVFDQWNRDAECWKVMNQRAGAAIQERKQPGDILGITVGVCQQDIWTWNSDMRAVEWGIGYEGIIDHALHVFESSPWMHYVYGMKHFKDGRFFDAVIPNSFDQEDYIYKEEHEKEDYLLYLGRLTPRKGMDVLKELAKRGHRIVAAGQGDLEIDGVEHVGVVRGTKKADLLANAKALLVPTFYIEPFGGVAVEAMISGTPVISTDFGAFMETVVHDVTGFRCHTISEFADAADRAEGLSAYQIRSYAEQYLTKNVRYLYDDYFKRVSLLDDKGWYS